MDKHLSEMTLAELTREGGIKCSCGTIHRCGLKFYKAGPGAVRELPEALKQRGRARPFVVMDRNTKKAAGDRVRKVLKEAGIPFT